MLTVRRLPVILHYALLLGYSIWAGGFLYRTTVIGIDGKRYFSLFDDAMISMRYAWNLAHGQGLVWNAGERVEGYTNFLMTLLMSLASALFSKRMAVCAVQVAGIAFMLIASLLIVAIVREVMAQQRLTWRPWYALLASLCVLGYYPLSFWSIMGMETGLLTMLLLLSVLAALKVTGGGSTRWRIILALAMSAAYLTRMDALLFIVIIGGYLTWDAGSRRMPMRQYATAIAPIFLACGAVIAAHTLWRHAYYGAWVPNTYLLKVTGMPLPDRLRDGWGFLSFFVPQGCWAWALALPALAVTLSRRTLFLVAFPVVLLLYQLWTGGDPWPLWRILSPGMPLLLALILLGAARVWDHCAQQAIPRSMSTAVVGVLLAAAAIALYHLNVAFRSEITFQERPFSVQSNSLYVNTAVALNHLLLPGGRIGVICAGIIPYYTDAYAVDFLGKCDRTIARLQPDRSGAVCMYRMKSLPGHNKYNLRYSFTHYHPDFAQQLSWGRDRLDASYGLTYDLYNYRNVLLYLRRGSPYLRSDAKAVFLESR